MRHLKRQKIMKKWPIPKKGTKFVVKPSSGKIPLLILVRDMLKVAQNRKEVKKALNLKNILLNNKPAKDEKIGATLFDTITLVPSKKTFKLVINKNGKYALEEIKAGDADKKIAKITDKKTVKKKKVQLNLYDGNNFISDIGCKVNDSVLVNLKEKKIEKCLPLKEKAKIIVFAGKHSGKQGSIEKVMAERKMAAVKTDEKTINVLIKQIMVIA